MIMVRKRDDGCQQETGSIKKPPPVFSSTWSGKSGEGSSTKQSAGYFFLPLLKERG